YIYFSSPGTRNSEWLWRRLSSKNWCQCLASSFRRNYFSTRLGRRWTHAGQLLAPIIKAETTENFQSTAVAAGIIGCGLVYARICREFPLPLGEGKGEGVSAEPGLSSFTPALSQRERESRAFGALGCQRRCVTQ